MDADQPGNGQECLAGSPDTKRVGQRAVFSAEGTLNPEDWGLTWNMPLDGGGLLVSRDIRIEIEAEAVLQA